MSKLVSIIIPVKNGQATIAKCLNSLKQLNYDNFEVFVINDGSTDGTGVILDAFAKQNDLKISVLNTNSAGPSIARNLGIRQSKGEYIAFTDADCIVDKEWLNELIKPLDDKTAGVGGIQLSPNDETEFGRNVNDFMGKIGFVTDYMKASGYKGETMETDHNPTCNAIYKKEIFNVVGYFLDNLWPGEDVELDYRIKKAGYKLLVTTKAIVYHYRPGNLRKYAKMMHNYGKVQALLVKKYGFFRKIQYIPAAVIFLFAVFIFIGLNNLMLLIWLLISMDISLGTYFYLKTNKFTKTINFSVLFYTTVLSWNYGFVKGVISKRV